MEGTMVQPRPPGVEPGVRAREAAAPRWRRALAGLALPLLVAGSASAAWQPDGIPLNTLPGEHTGAHVMFDGLGGAYVVWTSYDFQTRPSYRVRAQHLTSAGDPATGWSSGGVEIAPNGSEQDLMGAGPDGSTGLVVGVCDGSGGRMVRLRADGTPV